MCIRDRNNTGAGALNLVLTDGGLTTGATERLTNAGGLTNITGYSQSSGNFAIAGTGTFGTGTGAISLNGVTTVSAGFRNAGAVTGQALAIFNETGDQAIITASASGVTKFTVNRDGSLVASGAISGLTGITTSGSITNTGLASGALYSNSGVITSEAQLAIARGGTNGTATPTQGGVTYGLSLIHISEPTRPY